MADVNANIHINVDATAAHEQLRRLQSEISSFNRSLGTANSAAASSAAALNRALMDGINSSRMFDARMVPVISRVDAFSHALEKNKLTLGEYTKYAASQLPGLSRLFRTEFDTIERTARDRVKRINAQYIEMGKNAKGMREALQATPTGLATNAATDLAIATQRQQIFNKLIDDGSTKLLNWGKNTQWAGRQLMVGFTLPLAALGTVASQAFMEIDKATVAFERVYGDLSTTTAEMERNKTAVMGLASEYTKYGIAVSDTIQLSARVAATGLTNTDMLAATEQSLRFATLGQIDYNQALDATIALQSAFNVQSKDLGSTIDYLNAVENQTILSIEDMSAAIPRVATVIQGLGGDVKDLAVFMTAMREGGVSAENGANALKSGLASLINPTDRAQEAMAKLGIDMQAIINANRGDLMGTVSAFGEALAKVDEFSRTQALEQIFGKYQYARMAALFDNIAKSSSQAARAMDLANMSVAELAALSNKELSKIEESTTVKFEAAMERLKLSIAPLGEAFLKGIMPIMEGLTKLAEAFNNLPDPVKNVFAVITGIVAGLGPVFLMTIGLIGNGVANLVKGIQFMRKRIAGIKGDAANFEFLAKSELEAKTAAEQLDGSVVTLTNSLGIQKAALAGLIRQYERYASVAGVTAGTVAAAGRRGGRRAATAAPPLTMARGGVVPGSGSGDKVPALLEPGETVITKKASQRYGPVIAAMNAGTLPGFQFGLDEGITGATYNPRTRGSAGLARMSQSLEQYLNTLENGQQLQEEINNRLQELSRTQAVTVRDIKAIVRDVTGQQEMFSNRPAGRRSMGAPQWAREQSRAMQESGQFASEEAFIRARLGGDIPDDMFKIDASHIQKEVDEFGKKIWTASNLFPDFRGVNQTLEARMLSFDTAIQKGTISISDTAAMMRERTPSLLEGLSAEEVEFELDRLRQGIHPVTENATRVATSFAELDAALSREALGLGLERTQLGTVAATGRNAEFFAAAGQYRLGEGREEYFGAGGRSEQRYAQASQRTAREATNLVDDASDAIDAALERNSPAERVARAGDDMDRGLAEGIRRSANLPVAAARDVADDTARAMDPQAAFKQSQGEQRRTLRQIDMIPQTRARMKQEAMREAAIGGGDRRQQIRAARRRVEEMTDEQVLAVIQQEESQRIARERQASAERRAIRAKSDSAIAKERNAEATADRNAAKARSRAANLNAQRVLQDVAAQAAAGQAYDINTREQVQGRRGIASRVGGAMMRRSGTIGMGLGMASMIPFMAQNEEGKFMGMNANALGMGMGAAGMAFDMASLVKLGPVMGIATKAAGALGLSLGGLAAATGGVTLAVGAAVIAYKLWRDSVDNANRAAAELGANLGGTANALNNMSAILGKMTPAQSRTQLQLGITGEQMNEEMAQWANMLSEGPGKTFIDELKGATSEERFKKLADYIRYGIASGAMDITQARQFADAVALQLDDALLSIRVKAETANQQTGTAAMMGLARSRQAAVAGSEALQNVNFVLQPGDRFRDTEATFASEVIGSSLQVVQDFANASALAAAELASGKITQAEYEKAVADSNSAIATSTDNMIKAMRATDDLGGTMAAFNDQLIKLGMTAEQASAIAGMTGVGVAGQGMTTRASQAEVRAEAGAAAAQGMSFENIQAIYDYMKSDEGKRTVANTFGRLAGTGQAYGAAGLQMSMEQGGVPGLQGADEAETQKNIERTMEVAIKFIETGGTAAEFQQFIMSIPSEKVMDIQTRYLDAEGNVTDPEGLKQEIDSYNKLLPSLGADTAYAVTQKAGGQVSEKTIDAAAKLKQIFGDNQEGIDRYINIAMTTEPNGLETYLPQITKEIENLNAKVPPDIQKLIGINLENPEDLEKYGPMADALSLLVPIIQGLPEEQKEFAASIIFNAEENGEPKDPITFGKDIAKYNKTLDKLRSTKKKVRKEAAIDLIMQAYDAQGKPIDPKQAQDAMNYMLEELGISEGEFLQLPPDTISKIIQFGVEAKGLEESAQTYQAMADAAFAAGDSEAGRMYQNAANRMFAAAAVAKKNAAAAAGAGFAKGGNELPGKSDGGGGGGGGKEDPFKSLKQTIMEQVKTFVDINAEFNKLFEGKQSFFAMILKNNSLDAKIRKAGISGPLADAISQMSPEDAKKVLGRITTKGGKLTQEGRKMERAALLGTVGEQMRGAERSIGESRAQVLATQKLATGIGGRGAGASTSPFAIEAIAGDPEKAKVYIELVRKAQKAYENYQNAQGKGAKNKAKGVWDEASEALDRYVAKQVKAAQLQAGAAAVTGINVDTAQNVRTQQAMKQFENMPVSEGVDAWVQANKEQFANILAGHEGNMNKAVKEVQEFVNSMDPQELANMVTEQKVVELDEQRQPFLDQVEFMKAEFEVAFNEMEQAAKGAIEASRKEIQRLQDSIDAVGEEIKALEKKNLADQRTIRTYEREKEFLNRRIEATEYQNELDQRRADALSRQIEMINRQIEVLDRANELDQRRIDALSRQSEMIGRAQEQINRQIEASERQNELDQRAIDSLSREDEMRQRTAEALNRELELMSRSEEKIRSAYDERIKQLDQIEKAQQRINQQQQDQLDLAKALSTGDIYAAAAAAQQMRQNQIQSARQDTRTALEQGMQNQVAGLRTSGGLSREQAETQVQGIQDQSYQVQLQIRDIQDQIYNRQQAMIPLRDQLYTMDLQIRDINDQILVIQDGIYTREQERIPFLDQIKLIENDVRTINDAIYQRNLDMLPVKDSIRNYDTEIRKLQDLIYDRETEILKIQDTRLTPLQEALDKENKSLKNKELALQNQKDSFKVNGLTYEQLNDTIQTEAGIYNYQKAQLKANNRNAEAVKNIADNWNKVIGKIAEANRLAKSQESIARATADAMAKDVKIDPETGLPDPKDAQRAKENARTWLNSELARIESERTSSISGLRQGAINYMSSQFSTGGFVSGDGSRDSVFAKLTPGEFVVRKAMVNKYGSSFLSDINAGAMPRYSFAQFGGLKSGGSKVDENGSPVYNTYSVNVNIPNAQVNADEVAMKVMQKIKTIESSSVRSYRGF